MKAQRGPVVCGMGLVALDATIGPSESTNDELRVWTGGTCGNVLAALRFLGWQSKPIARLGNDAAGNVIKADLSSFGVDVSLLELEARSRTPVILHRIRAHTDGVRTHGYGWACPHCKERFASFRPVLSASTDDLRDSVTKSAAFFFDRVSRSAIDLAEAASVAGAVVVFEPSAVTEPSAFAEAMKWVDVLKYADDRREKLNECFRALPRSARPLLEIETRGAGGVRYRAAFDRAWVSLPALLVQELWDAAGSGDWLTAGMISRIAANGKNGLGELDSRSVQSALAFGQALAAWNCAFEGARGGMYQQTHAPVCSDVLEVLSAHGFKRQAGRSQVQRRRIAGICDRCVEQAQEPHQKGRRAAAHDCAPPSPE